MQYPAGTTFAVSRASLGKANLAYKHHFADGAYTVLRINRIQDRIVYSFSLNRTTLTSLSCNSCTDMDKIIAFCRREAYTPPAIADEFDTSI